MINVQMREEHALNARRNSSNHVGSAFSYMHLIERHDLSNHPRNAVAAGIGQFCGRLLRLVIHRLQVLTEVLPDSGARA